MESLKKIKVFESYKQFQKVSESFGKFQNVLKKFQENFQKNFGKLLENVLLSFFEKNCFWVKQTATGKMDMEKHTHRHTYTQTYILIKHTGDVNKWKI